MLFLTRKTTEKIEKDIFEITHEISFWFCSVAPSSVSLVILASENLSKSFDLFSDGIRRSVLILFFK